MGTWSKWKEEIDKALAAKDVGKNTNYVLTRTPVAEPDFFDIPRLRPYFTMDSLYGSLRWKIRYVTSTENCSSPIHAARIYCSIIKHLNNKLGIANPYASVQDDLTRYGAIDTTLRQVSFDIVFTIKGDTAVSKPPAYYPTPAEAARKWRQVFGPADNFRTTNTSSTTTTPTVTNLTSVTNTPGTEAVKPATVEQQGVDTGVNTSGADSVGDGVVAPGAESVGDTTPKVTTVDVDEAEGTPRTSYLAQLRSKMREALPPPKAETSTNQNAGGSSSSVSTTSRWSSILDQTGERNRVADLGSVNTVAVYGSLRAGEHNNQLMRGAKFIGRGRIDGRIFPLGPTVPGAHFDPGVAPGVVVELYECDRNMMDRLDRLEGYTGTATTSAYNRIVRSAVMEDGREILAFVYEYAGSSPKHHVADGDWLSYRKHVETSSTVRGRGRTSR